MNEENIILGVDPASRATQPEIDTPAKRAAIAYITKEVGGETLVLAIYNYKHKAWSLPGGKFEAEKDADLLQTVNRELLEETGLVATSATKIYEGQTYVRTPKYTGACTPLMVQDETQVTVFQVTAHGVPVALETNQAVGWVTQEFLESQENAYARNWFFDFFDAVNGDEDSDEDCDEDY